MELPTVRCIVPSPPVEVFFLRRTPTIHKLSKTFCTSLRPVKPNMAAASSSREGGWDGDNVKQVTDMNQGEKTISVQNILFFSLFPCFIEANTKLVTSFEDIHTLLHEGDIWRTARQTIAGCKLKMTDPGFHNNQKSMAASTSSNKNDANIATSMARKPHQPEPISGVTELIKLVDNISDNITVMLKCMLGTYDQFELPPLFTKRLLQSKQLLCVFIYPGTNTGNLSLQSSR